MTAQSHSVEEENVRIVKATIDAYNAHDVNRHVQHVSESAVAYGPFAPQGVKGSGRFITEMTADVMALPDVRFNIDRIIGQEDEVSVRGSTTGTNTGSWVTAKGRRVRASGKRINIPQAYFYRLQEGKIIEVHEYWDRRALDAYGFLRKNTFTALAFIFIGLVLMIANLATGSWLHSLASFGGLIAGVILAVNGALWMGRTMLRLSKG